METVQKLVIEIYLFIYVYLCKQNCGTHLMFLFLGNIERESFRRKTSPVESSAEPEEAATRDPPTPRRSYSKSAPTHTKPNKIPQKTQRFSISNLFTRSTGSEKENHTSVSSIPGAFLFI